MSFLTVEDVREDMMDRAAEDHLVLADLAFTDDDVKWAMKSCARKFNSLQPFVVSVTWDTLPERTSVFLDGTAWALLRRMHRNAAMNDMDYQAGNVTANVQGKLVANLDAMVKDLERQFVESATNLKITINIGEAFGPIG